MKNIFFTLILVVLQISTFAQGTGTTNWTAATGNATETVYTQNVTIPGCSAPITVTLTLSGSGVDDVNAGGSGPAGTGTSNRLNTNLKFDNPSESLVWTVTFSEPVSNVNFTIWQVDRTSTTLTTTFQDQVTFAGSPTVTAASNSAPFHTISGTTVTGINNISSTALTNAPTVNYGAGAISGFSFEWTNGPDITGAAFPSGYAGQTVGLGAINITRAACPMPVTLVSFVAKKEDSSIALNWETSSETNSDYFDVQKSTDAKSFETIGRKQTVSESSSLVGYAFKDEQPLEGLNYYRLKMVDKDATYSYSRTLAIDYQTNESYFEVINSYVDGYVLTKTNLNDPQFVVFDELGRNILTKTTGNNGLYKLFIAPKNGLIIIKAFDELGSSFTKKTLIWN
jgi:hypothetical protein